MTKRWICLSLLLVLSCRAFAQSPIPSVRDCDGKLLADIDISNVDDRTKADFFSLITTQNFNEASHGVAGHYGAVGGNYNDFSKAYSNDSAMQRASIDSSHAAAHLQQFLSPNGLAAYQACLKALASNQIGLYTWVTKEDSQKISFFVQWHNPPIANNVVGNVSVNGLAADEQFLAKGQNVGTNYSHSFTLNRAKPRAEVDINFDIDGFPAQLISLPADDDTGIIPGKIIQKVQLDRGGAFQCSDPKNTDSVFCPWWDVVVHPISKHSHFVINGKVSVKFMRVADQGDPKEHSAGNLYLTCNNKDVFVSREFANNTENASADLMIYGSCTANSDLRVQVRAHPRGVSGMFAPQDSPPTSGEPVPSDFLLIEEVSD